MLSKEYWNQRATFEVFYQGEDFYTITPLPYYSARRKILLDLFSKSLQGPSLKILDFGCGDGWYVNWLSKGFHQHDVKGTDLSESMLEKARKLTGKGVFFSPQI